MCFTNFDGGKILHKAALIIWNSALMSHYLYKGHKAQGCVSTTWSSSSSQSWQRYHHRHHHHDPIEQWHHHHDTDGRRTMERCQGLLPKFSIWHKRIMAQHKSMIERLEQLNTITRIIEADTLAQVSSFFQVKVGKVSALMSCLHCNNKILFFLSVQFYNLLSITLCCKNLSWL